MFMYGFPCGHLFSFSLCVNLRSGFVGSHGSSAFGLSRSSVCRVAALLSSSRVNSVVHIFPGVAVVTFLI